MNREIHEHFRSLCFRSVLLTAIFGVVFLLSSSFADAQSTGGRIRGTVTDASGAAVAGATVTLINMATNVTREATTSGNGEYLFLEVPVGTYEIDFNQAGFKKFVRRDIGVNLNQVVGVDITLQVGATSETVEVTGQPPVIDTSSTQLGAVVNERSSTQLPLNERDVYQLLQLQPGVQSQLGNDTFYGSDRPGVVTVNGGRGRANNYSVNGGDGNDLFANLPAVQPSPDSIEEFRVITNSFDAEYGRNSGAVVNVVTKSGTNEFHGNVYEFFRNTDLNAKPFTFSPAPKPDFHQNQFGGTLGGPIKKDKSFFFVAYEGRRIIQGVVSQPVSVPTSAMLNNGDFSQSPLSGIVNGTSPTPLVASMLNERPGCTAAGGGPIVAGTLYSTIFPNSQIPTACFDPVAVSLAKLYVPTTTNVSGQVIEVPNKIDNGNQYQGRFDHSWNTNQRTSVYYYYDQDNLTDPLAKFQAAGDPLGTFPGLFSTTSQQINATHTSTIGSTAVNEFRFTYFREGQGQFNAPEKTNLIQDSCGTGTAGTPYCFNGTSESPTVNAICEAGTATSTNGIKDCGLHSGLGASKEGVPYISVNGGFTIGNNYEGQLPQTGNTYQFSDNYSKIIGNHSIKFGGDFRIQQFNQLLYYNINGWFTFLSYADYFLGLPNTLTQGSAQNERVRSNSVYLFAQDSWKIRPNLTLNYGLRWEMNTPLTDIGKKVQTFRPGQVSTIYPCQLSPSNPYYIAGQPDGGCAADGFTPVGLVFPGDKNVPNALTNTYYKGFAPRLGMNWSPSWNSGFLGKLGGGPGRTSVSAGYGIFYNPIEQLVLEQFSAEPPFGGSSGITSPLFETPYIDQNGTVYSNPFNGILNPPRGTPIDWSRFQSSIYFGQFPANIRMQYSDQYNLTIKRQLGNDLMMQIAYVGSQGHRLLASYELNPGNPQTCNDLAALGQGCSAFGEDGAYSFVLPAGQVFHLPYAPGGPNGQNIPCPVTNASSACTVTGAAGGTPITLVGIRPYSSPLCNPLTGAGCPVNGTPVFSAIFTENTVAWSNYNSFQAMLQKNFSHGLMFQAAYTFGKSLDNASSFESNLNPLNFRATYGPSAYDARQRFVVNYVWDLPIPKAEGFKGKLVTGWELSGIASFQTGFPVRITSLDDVEQLDNNYLFEQAGEPNFAPGYTNLVRTNIRQTGGFAFNPNQFTNSTVAPGTIGNAARTLCCGPGINNWDMSFMKETMLGERVRMEFRGDVFNIWNHAQFYSVDGNVSNQGATFGQVQHIHDPRLVQFALKFYF
jgi:Carboxypeptidase regulatory-like domain